MTIHPMALSLLSMLAGLGLYFLGTMMGWVGTISVYGG